MFDVLTGRGALRHRRALQVVFTVGLVLVAGTRATAKNPGPGGDDDREGDGRPGTVFDSPNGTGVARTIALNGNTLDTSNPFFQSLGSNGRSCVSCHVPSTGWTVSPPELRERFERTKGLDPVFRTNDGSTSPTADASTEAARRSAYAMLLNRGLIRVGMPIPANGEFDLVGVDDPYQHANAADLSLFRRPIPSTNLRFLTAVMWDGRESYAPGGTFPILDAGSPGDNAQALLADLKHQADGATVGHAQGAHLSDAQQTAIAMFELNLATSQQVDKGVGSLTAQGAGGGAENLSLEPFYVTINDVLGGDVQHVGQFNAKSMTLFDAWAGSRDRRRAAIARGAAIFGTKKINITGVGGLNDELGAAVIPGTCSTCHDSPNVGGHSVSLPVDIGLTDASRRTHDMPLYTLRNRTTGEQRQTTDPGRALVTGRWKDIGKFKGPILRGLASRPPYFHDGSAEDLGEVVDFYDTRFNIGLTEQEKSDLVAFLSAL